MAHVANAAVRLLDTPDLRIAYQAHGDPGGWPVILLHGFPYDVHAFDAVVPHLTARGAHVIVPWLRGYGATRIRDTSHGRAGQQAAIGADLLALMDGLGLPHALLGGFDWGNRAACIVAALHPVRVDGLVSCGGYSIQDIGSAGEPVAPAQEHRFWYQFYFGTQRGREGLSRDRHALCELLWRLWSPRWAFSAEDYARTAAAFDNPDFVDVVIHSYRHRLGLAPDHPAYAALEARLAALPSISVSTIVLEGDCDGVSGPPSQQKPGRFTGWHEHRTIEGAGHAIPQEAPAAFAQALLDLHARDLPR